MRHTGMMCVGCGGNATQGSMKHPYCKKCWDKTWAGKPDEWREFLKNHIGGI